MKTVADLVIGSDGFLSVFLDRERALQWASRCGGVLDDLVSRVEAEAEAREAFRRGLCEGQALSNAQSLEVVSGSSASDSQTG